MADGGGTQVPLTDILSTTFGLPPLEPTANGRQQQTGAEKQQESLSHGGTDPKYIADFEVFEGLSHQDIYNAVQQMQPGVMQQFGDKWVAMFTELSGAVTGLMVQTARATSSLQGEFASAGEAAGRRFVTEATDVYTVLSAVGHRVKAAAYGAEAVKVAVPAPVNSSEAVDVGTSVPATLAELAVPGNAATVEREKEDRRLQAIAAMNLTYKPTYGPAGENVPTFVAPTHPGTGGDIGTGTGTGGGGSNNGGTNGGGNGNNADAGTSGDPGTTTDDTAQPESTDGDDDTSSAGTDTGNSNGDDNTQGQNTADPTSTNPAATAPAAATPGTGTNPTGGSPGSGSPGGGAGAGGGGTLGPGGSVPGRSPVGAGQNLAAAGLSGAAGAAAARGMGSPGMMGAPGARGGKGDDDEHQAPDYLRGVQPELLGPEQPTVPGAIGSDAPATRLAEDQGSAGAS